MKLSYIPTNSQIVLGYLMKAQWATYSTIANKTLIRTKALNGTLGHLVRSGRILRVDSPSDKEVIYVYRRKTRKSKA